MKSRKKVQDRLYLPLKVNNGKLEYMFDPRGKMKSYRSEETLKEYSPDYDEIAIYKLFSIKKNIIKKLNSNKENE